MAKGNILSKLAEALRGARADVAAIRDHRLVVIEKIEATRNAPATDAEINERVDALLDSAEHRAREWASLSGLASANGGTPDIAAAVRHEPLGIFSMFNREAVRGRLISEARAGITGKPIARAEREAALAKFAGELIDLENAEEKAIRDGEEAGAVIHRRADADPAVYLAEEV